MTTDHALGALISQVKTANGWSDQTISERAASRGHDISKSNVARIRTEPVTTIGSKQLFALEAGLGVPVRQLAQAALQSMGILDFSTSAADAEHAITADPTLPLHIRETLLTIIRTERLSRKAAANAGSHNPPAQSRTPSEASQDQKTKDRDLSWPDQDVGIDVSPSRPAAAMGRSAMTPRLRPVDANDVETLNPDDEVSEEEFADAARKGLGQSQGELLRGQQDVEGES